MAIATRPKPKSYHKKRQAGHHRQSKHYVKAYWPYLPMFAILGAGVLADRTWQVEPSSAGTAAQAAAGGGPVALEHATSRLQVVSGDSATWLGGVVAVIAAAALVFFMLRNAARFHKLLVRGEHFISTNPVLDIAAVGLFTAGFVLLG